MGKRNSNEIGIPYGARERMPFWYTLAWSSRGISAGINVVLVMYVTYYCTDMLGLDAGIVGGLLVASKIVDAFTDLGVGYLIDRTHTRWGKARPYELFIALDWLFTVLLYSVPDMSQTMQYVYVLIMYLLINAICLTALGGADVVYQARTFTTDNNRIKAMSVNGIVVMFCTIVFNIILPQLISGIGATKSGWSKMSLMLGIPLTLIGLLRFFICKEIVQDDQNESVEKSISDSKTKKQDVSFGETIATVAKNKYLLIVVGLMMVCCVINGMGTATTYYFKYWMGDVGLMSIASFTGLIAPLGLVFFPLLAKKFGTTHILQVCAVLSVIGVSIRTIGGTNMTTILIGGALLSIGSMPINLMINTYLIDCMDYGEWKTGIRVEGMIASIVNFANKAGGAIAAGVVGLVMGLASYNGSLEVQPDNVMTAIVGLYNWLPLALCILMLILAMAYKVDKIRPQMKADLEKRRGNTERS